jgi:GT2 family glycosyltransferase
VYNRADRIAAAINSVGLKAFADCELIVVDDGSLDDSADVAHRALDGMSAQLMRQANGGPGSARNLGAAQASGTYLAFLDSDDRWFPWTLAAIRDEIARHPDVAMVFLQTVDVVPDANLSAIAALDSQPTIAQVFPDYTAAAIAQWGLRYGACNLVMRRDVFTALAGFCTEVRNAEDSDLILRGARFGPCVVLTGRPLVAHAKGADDALTANLEGGLRGLEFCIARNRAGRYPQTAVNPVRIFAWSAITLIRKAFQTGDLRCAYGLLARYAWLICRGGAARKLVRLVLTPALGRTI